MSTTAPFTALDAAAVALDGVNIVEANAGTGKTFSIASLYLRLLLESGLGVDQILVVSFTEAATAELRTRIRQRLASVRDAIETGNCDEPFTSALIRHLDDPVVAQRRLTRALQSFDEAAIFTIHGFCQRLLADAGFETGMLYEAELVTDDSLIRRQIVGDFWRQETASGSGTWLEWLLRMAPPSRLAGYMQKYFARPALQRLPVPAIDQQGVDATQFDQAYRALQKRWPADRDALLALLSDDSVLNQQQYKPTQLEKLFAAADQWSVCRPDLETLLALEKLGAAKISVATKKNNMPPDHEFFDNFQTLLTQAHSLQAEYQARLADLHVRLLDYADRELPARKRALRQRFFDDLLNDVYAVLETPMAQRLAETMRYKAALIDEFQDTDPVQFKIVDRLFCDAGKPVFLVGDPKQAIYSFRGADVFAYLRARRQAGRAYRLADNYRSTPVLVDAVNKVFERPQAFMLDEIGYQPSRAAIPGAQLVLDGTTLPAQRWWQVATDGATLSSPAAREALAAATATDIARLLDLAAAGRLLHLDGTCERALLARDIAVLVRTHHEGDVVRAELSRRGVAAVQRTEQSVFDSAEAVDLAIVLRAVARPSNAIAVRAALSTALLGYSASELLALADDDTQWQQLLDAFAGYHLHWRRVGYAPMQRTVMRDFDIDARLLALSDGRRRLTNLLHLEDLLQRESSLRHANADELLQWMNAQRNKQIPMEQALLRLESDENLVRILTVHFAKGLQFPVVYAPFLLHARDNKPEPVVEFHDAGGVPTLDLGTDRIGQHREIRQNEDYAESLRLAYVALTRAEVACTSAWGPVKAASKSPLAWLLHGREGEVPASLSRRLNKLPAADWHAALEADIGTVMPLPEPGSRRLEPVGVGSTLSARAPAPAAPAVWRVSSFSALTRHAVEQPRDYDALASALPIPSATPVGIFAFPRGARAGRAMHSLFERIAFDATVGEIEPVATAVLSEHGFASADAGVLAQMAHDVLNTALDARGAIRLSGITAAQRVSEMEFYFPLRGSGGTALHAAFDSFVGADVIAQRIAALDVSVQPGFMRGFIDLIFEHDGSFYILDYKSNWLGPAAGEYHESKLAAEIARHDYYLQYLIYTVALQRHLRNVLPGYDYDSHFGGIYYLFLRGMQPDLGASHGVFADRPTATLIERLERALCGDPSR